MQAPFYNRWKHAIRPAVLMTERMPWISFPGPIDLLSKTLGPADGVFEYGGGGSTLFWIDRVAEVVTVEHDAEWFNALKDRMKGEQRADWDGTRTQRSFRSFLPAPDPRS